MIMHGQIIAIDKLWNVIVTTAANCMVSGIYSNS